MRIENVRVCGCQWRHARLMQLQSLRRHSAALASTEKHMAGREQPIRLCSRYSVHYTCCCESVVLVAVTVDIVVMTPETRRRRKGEDAASIWYWLVAYAG